MKGTEGKILLVDDGVDNPLNVPLEIKPSPYMAMDLARKSRPRSPSKLAMMMSVAGMSAIHRTGVSPTPVRKECKNRVAEIARQTRKAKNKKAAASRKRNRK